MGEPGVPPGQWSVPGSNRRPSACKADALPTELTPRACQSVGEADGNAYTPTTPGHVLEARYNPVTGIVAFTDRSYDLGDQPITGIAEFGPTGDLYAATDFGVLRLPSGASHWENAGTSLPPVAVYGLTLSQSAHVLYAATHGRGAYVLSLPTS